MWTGCTSTPFRRSSSETRATLARRAPTGTWGGNQRTAGFLRGGARDVETHQVEQLVVGQPSEADRAVAVYQFIRQLSFLREHQLDLLLDGTAGHELADEHVAVLAVARTCEACGSRRGERRVGGHGSRAAGAARESATRPSRGRRVARRAGQSPRPRTAGSVLGTLKRVAGRRTPEKHEHEYQSIDELRRASSGPVLLRNYPAADIRVRRSLARVDTSGGQRHDDQGRS